MSSFCWCICLKRTPWDLHLKHTMIRLYYLICRHLWISNPKRVWFAFFLTSSSLFVVAVVCCCCCCCCLRNISLTLSFRTVLQHAVLKNTSTPPSPPPSYPTAPSKTETFFCTTKKSLIVLQVYHITTLSKHTLSTFVTFAHILPTLSKISQTELTFSASA